MKHFKWILWSLTISLLSLSAAQNTAADYGLQEGRPFDGTELNFLICCPTADQFMSLSQRTDREFTPMTGISVRWGDVAYDAFQERLLVEGATGTGAFDLFSWVDSWGPSIRPFAVPLNERIDEAGIDMTEFPQVYRDVAAMGTDDTYYGIPFRGHPLILFYRTDVFEALDLEPPTTWQDVIRVGQVIRDNADITPISMYYGISGSAQNVFLWLSHLWGAGSDIFDEEYRPVFNNEAGVEATQAYIDILREHRLTSQAATAYGEAEATTEFAQGRAAMLVGWWWMYANFRRDDISAPEVVQNVAFAPAPGWEGGETASYALIWPVGIFNASRNIDAAWEYIKWLTHPAIELVTVLDKSEPQTSTIMAVRTSVLQNDEVNELHDGLHRIAAEILSTARTQPLIPEWPDVEGVLEVAINRMANGADVQRTLDEAAQEIEDIMSMSGYY